LEKNEFIKFLKEQILLEEQIVAIATASVKSTKNQLVHHLIEGIGLDSKKHALILQAIIAHLESKTPFITEEKRNELGRNISHHIELEAKAIKTYSTIIPKTTDSGIKNLLEYILEDERRHHKLLKEIYNAIIQKETLTEQDLWDLTWKDVPFHGSPGG